MPNPTKLTIVVRNAEEILFSGQAEAVSSINDKGPFDILSGHENFITLIKDKIVLHPTLKEEKKLDIENGIMRIYENKVFAYVNFKY